MKLGLGLGFSRGGGDTVNDLVVYAAGQSNIAYEFTQYSGAGETAFDNEAGLYFDTVDYRNAAVGGSTLDSWWNGSAGTNATALLAAIDAQQSSRSDVNVIRWNWGEQNGADGDSKATIKADCLALFNYLRSEIGNQLVIVIDQLGRRTTDVSNAYWQNVKEAYLELIAENSWIHAGAERYDQALADTQHMDQAGYEEQAERDARVIAGIFGKIPKAGTLGPQIQSASIVEPDVIEMILTHDGGTDFTPTSGIEGINVAIDGSFASPTVTRKDADTLKIVLSEGSAPEDGETTIVYNNNGQQVGLDNTKVVKDNATNSLPLRTGLVTASQDDPVQGLDNVVFYADPRASSKTYNTGTRISAMESLKGTIASAGPVVASEGPTYDATAFSNAGGFTFDNVDRELLVGDLGTAGGPWTIAMPFKFMNPLVAAYFFGFGASGGATDAQTLLFMTNSGQVRYSVNSLNAIETVNDGYAADENQIFFFEFDEDVLNMYDMQSGAVTLAGTITPRNDWEAYDYMLLFNSSSTRLAPVGAEVGALLVTNDFLSSGEKSAVASMWNDRFNLGL